MTNTEEMLLKLGFKLEYKQDDIEVYINNNPGFYIEVAYFYPRNIRITVSAKFNDTKLKIQREYPLIFPIGIKQMSNYIDLKEKIKDTLNIFSNILISKSDEFKSEIDRIEKIANTDFYQQ